MKHERLWTLGNRLRASEGRGGDWDRPVMGIKEGTYCMCTGCYTQVMNHGTLHQKLGLYCMVTNIIKNYYKK